jgi:carbonic anhydrase/acetyltransferase-like protein (isoleucine patch superfamily)
MRRKSPEARLEEDMKSLYFIMVIMGSVSISGERILPHVARIGGGFETSIRLTNNTPVNQQVILTGYRQSGSSLGSRTITLSAGEHSFELAENLFSSDISHIIISGNDLVAASLE